MTYCLGLHLQDGLIMIADTRTNAGVDNVSVFKKLHTFAREDERVLAIAAAGNLSVTQTLLAYLAEGLEPPEGGAPQTLLDTPNMFRSAELVARALKRAYDHLKGGLIEAGVAAGVTLLFGGQIRGGPVRLYLIYDAGNFIECGPDAPYLQVGETKYGKPILDWALKRELALDEGLKIGLISMESTLRSNLAVGLPLDVLVLRADAFACEVDQRIEADDPYFRSLSEAWSASINEAQRAIAPPVYGRRPAAGP